MAPGPAASCPDRSAEAATMTTVSESTAPPGAEDTSAGKKRGGGPRTAEGRERAKRNALKHGLMAESVLPDDLAEVVAARTVAFNVEFAPATPYERWLVGQMALATAKLDRCAVLKILDLQRC